MKTRFATITALVICLAGLHTLAGCANDGGAKNPFVAASKDQNGAPTLVAADTANNRLVTMRDLTGAGWQSSGPTGKLNQPTALAVDGGQRIYALDTQGTRLVRIDSIGGGNFTAFGTSGSSTNQFQSATGLAVIPASGSAAVSKILIADTGNARLVSIDDLSGKNWATFTGSGSTTLHAPSAVAVDASSHIYIADTDHIVRIDSMDGSGLVSFGSNGSGSGQFQSISGIAVGSDGKIYVADKGNARIVRFDDLTGANWTTYTGVAAPAAISVDNSLHITIADPTNNRLVQISDMLGTGLTNFGTTGSGTGMFASPSGVSLIYGTAGVL